MLNLIVAIADTGAYKALGAAIFVGSMIMIARCYREAKTEVNE